MSSSIDSNISLANYRLEKAKNTLSVSKLILDSNIPGCYCDSANRSYYSMMYSMKACLALLGKDSKSHEGVISYFNIHFVKTGHFSKDVLRHINSASLIRNRSDYDDFYVVNKKDVIDLFNNAESLFANASAYINQFISLHAR